MHLAALADLHRRRPVPAEPGEDLPRRRLADAGARTAPPAAALRGRAFVASGLVHQRVHIEVRHAGGDGDGAGHAVTRLALEAGGLSAAVVVLDLHSVFLVVVEGERFVHAGPALDERAAEVAVLALGGILARGDARGVGARLAGLHTPGRDRADQFLVRHAAFPLSFRSIQNWPGSRSYIW